MPRAAGVVPGYRPGTPTVFDGGVIWVFLAFGVVFVLVVLNAYVPFRREPLTVLSFVTGFLIDEVPVHTAVVVLAGTAVLGGDVPDHSAVWWLALALCLIAVVGNLYLAVVAGRVGGLVDHALETATGGPIRADGVDLSPAWAVWWRLVVAIPFRFRGIRRIRNVDYAGDGLYRHKLDIIHRRADPPVAGPVLVYIQGGAWVIGDKREQGIPLVHELAARGWVCVAINYRLSPKATWPDHIVDCKRAVAWVREHIAEYGGDPTFLAVSGGSAGGHLSALVGLTPGAPEWQPGFEDTDTSVDACLPFYGVHDVTGDPEASGVYGLGLVDLLQRRVMKTTMEEDRVAFEQASPERRITASAPPMFVVQGSNDTLVPPQVGRRFAERLREQSESPVAYLELPGAQHAFDVVLSIRSRHTTLGAVRFLEGIRSRVSH